MRSLYDIVATRLRALDEQAALDEFVRQPRNNSLVRRLLSTAVREDPAFAAELAAAVDAAPVTSSPERHPAAGTGPHSAPWDVSTGAEEHPSGNRRRAAILGGLGILVVLTALSCLAVRAISADLVGGGGLTAQSTCEEFLRAPASEQSRAVREIGLATGVDDLDTPQAPAAIAQLCAGQPAARLGDVIEKLGG